MAFAPEEKDRRFAGSNRWLSTGASTGVQNVQKRERRSPHRPCFLLKMGKTTFRIVLRDGGKCPRRRRPGTRMGVVFAGAGKSAAAVRAVAKGLVRGGRRGWGPDQENRAESGSDLGSKQVPDGRGRALRAVGRLGHPHLLGRTSGTGARGRAVSTVSTDACVRSQRRRAPVQVRGRPRGGGGQRGWSRRRSENPRWRAESRIDGRGAELYTSAPFVRGWIGARHWVDDEFVFCGRWWAQLARYAR